jgi:hypothetical protein
MIGGIDGGMAWIRAMRMGEKCDRPAGRARGADVDATAGDGRNAASVDRAIRGSEESAVGSGTAAALEGQRIGPPQVRAGFYPTWVRNPRMGWAPAWDGAPASGGWAAFPAFNARCPAGAGLAAAGTFLFACVTAQMRVQERRSVSGPALHRR